MANIILISDGENHRWYNWLSKELIKRQHSFFIHQVPEKIDDVNEWILNLKEYRKHLGESSVLIGHGAGRVIVLKVLEEKLREISGALLISGKPIKDTFPNFSLEELDFSIIKSKANNFFVYASEHDDQESLMESQNIADMLDDEVLVLEDPNYFVGLEKLEDILIDILSLVD